MVNMRRNLYGKKPEIDEDKKGGMIFPVLGSPPFLAAPCQLLYNGQRRFSIQWATDFLYNLPVSGWQIFYTMGNEDPWNPAQELKRYCIHKKQRHGIKGIMKENIKERKGAATRQFFSLCLPLFFFRRQEQSGRKGNKGRNAFPVMGFFFSGALPKFTALPVYAMLPASWNMVMVIVWNQEPEKRESLEYQDKAILEETNNEKGRQTGKKKRCGIILKTMIR